MWEEVHHVASIRWVAAPNSCVIDWTPKLPLGGMGAPEMTTMLGMAGLNFHWLFIFCPFCVPCLKVNPRKIIVGLRGVCNLCSPSP